MSMKKIAIGLAIGLSMSAVTAKNLPPLVTPSQNVVLTPTALYTFEEQDRAHIQELERKVSGMQGAINQLFARVIKLEAPKGIVRTPI